MHTTHNAEECNKYEKDGTMKKEATGRKVHGPLHGQETSNHNRSPCMSNFPKKLINLKSQTGNSSMHTRSTSTIMKVTGMTLIHPEELDVVVLGNICQKIRMIRLIDMISILIQFQIKLPFFLVQKLIQN